MGDVISILDRCRDHPDYRGDVPPKVACDKCADLYVRRARERRARANRIAAEAASVSMSTAAERAARQAEQRKKDNERTKRNYKLDKPKED